MRDKRVLIVMFLSLILVFAWTYVNQWMRVAHPEWFVEPTPQTTQPTPTQQQPGPAATQAATTQPGAFYAVGGERKPVDLGSDKFDPKGTQAYPMGVSFDPLGASLSSVTLNRFRVAVDKDAPYVFQKPYQNLEAASSRALATQAIIINGQRVDLHDKNWSLAQRTENSATYSIDLVLGGGQRVRVFKTYEIRPSKHPSFGYEILLTYRYENQTQQPVVIRNVMNGPTVPPPENINEITEIVAGFNDGGQMKLEHEPARSAEPGKDPFDIVAQQKLPLMWTGFTSAYFDTIVHPVADPKQSLFDSAKAKALAKRSDKNEDFTAITFEMKDLTVAAGQWATQAFEVYLGPRQRQILNADHYVAFPREYNDTLVLTGWCGFCTFEWLINIMVSLLGFFYRITTDWGLAIICLVIIVRSLLHPITKRSQISMSKLSKFGPEIERLKQKYGDDKEGLNREMMAFYREHGVSTGLIGCLPMFLQMPIWIALWSSLQSTFELRHASFLWGYTWIKDLSQPDRLIYFPEHAFKFWFFHFDAINLLPLLMAVVFWIQQKLTPRPPTMTKEQETQYKMMQYMSLLFPLLLYSGPSGLNIYILTSTTIGIIESKRIRDHIKAREEAEKQGKIIVDAPPTRHSKKHGHMDEPAPKKKGGLAGWLENLQKKAEELQREAHRKGKKS